MAIYIPGLSVSQLNSATHKECVTDVLKEAEKCAAIAERLPKELAAFKKAVEYETECYNERFKSALTEPLKELDRRRDEALSATRAANRAATTIRGRAETARTTRTARTTATSKRKTTRICRHQEAEEVGLNKSLPPAPSRRGGARSHEAFQLDV